MLNIYTKNIAAAEKLMPEAIIGMAIAREGEMEDGHIASFAPDTDIQSFDILSGPVQARFVAENRQTALAIAPDDNVSIGQAVLAALSAVASEENDGTKATLSQKPKH